MFTDDFRGDPEYDDIYRSNLILKVYSNTPAPCSASFNIGSLPSGFDQWIAACKGGPKDTPGNFIAAEALSTMVNLGYAALRAGQRIVYDPVNVEITNYPEANKYLTREYRPGWEL